MKAILLDGFGGPEVLKLGDVEAPAAGPGRVLIRVAATSVNRPDVVQRQGNYPPPPGESPILGLEAAGTVAAVGAGVTGFAAGERVFALLGGGGYAELAAAHAGHVMRIPANLSFEAGRVHLRDVHHRLHEPLLERAARRRRDRAAARRRRRRDDGRDADRESARAARANPRDCVAGQARARRARSAPTSSSITGTKTSRTPCCGTPTGAAPT